MAKKFIYFFGNGKADGKRGMKKILGGKGASLADMTNAGVNVPPGFTISTEVCTLFYKNKQKLPKALILEIERYVKKLEKATGPELGNPDNPLLVSVRSGAEISMPGMMDTILNLGLNDKTVKGLAKKTGDERFAYDCYRRFIMMFGNIVNEINKDEFEIFVTNRKKDRGMATDMELMADDMLFLVSKFKEVYKEKIGNEFPQSPYEQLLMAINAVFKSWNNNRAIIYRNLYNIPHNLGTAVNVQAMVFGNMGENSGTGVGFTRNPSTGENTFYGEFLLKAQGEDVVAGIRTPLPIEGLKDVMPETYLELRNVTNRLEKFYRDVQDFEFTIQEGRLYMLQTRSGKRTGHAAVKTAIDMVREKLISKKEAVLRVDPLQLDQLLHPIFDPVERKEFHILAKGLNASPGAAAGRVVFDADEAVQMASKGERVLLVRSETSPDDIHGMIAAKGVLTATGGMTSHAAVVGRQMGKPSIVGCSSIQVNTNNNSFSVGDVVVEKGDYISIDGSTGEVMLGDVPTKESEILQVLNGELKPEESEVYRNFFTLLSWADEFRKLGVRANADIPRDAVVAVKLGAEGIGLCRTEHMFFAEDRLPLVQQMILADNYEERKAALSKLLPLQREDFKGLFEAMAGYPVTIRTLDPPLHEFLPKREELMVEIALAKNKGGSNGIKEKEALLKRVNELHEFNPMMGMRGCRLGITLPEITAMQAEAIFEAACDIAEKGKHVIPEVMIPLVGHINELRNQKAVVNKIAEEVMARRGIKVKYHVGTMIEIPRAALTADKIAEEAEFFSFGTNDLTQMTFGFSRDDAGKFLTQYIKGNILERDPFVTIDKDGVGELIRIAVERGRNTRKEIKVGICGEHGGDPASIELCNEIGLNYVSCSPFRLPIARLSAAQAALKKQKIGKSNSNKNVFTAV